ncbi:hypothetical protein PIB30_066300 [Stylosanthes scabra]|uniref:Aminotransferase-like plant mobile domain-containing protein n=1 Tax=Stylosanthes scabra TaxID=79078 RepID=A0ABU6RM58_9FABA|nr:hypothetical protein [Stylosanthes scabra]
MAPRGRSRRQVRGDAREEQAKQAGPAAQAGPAPQKEEDLHRLNRVWHIAGALFRWTPYMTPGMQALIPDWMRSQGEVYTWRSAVPVVCFNYVHMHHVDRVIRQKRRCVVAREAAGVYYEWFARVARQGRFLSRAEDPADPRWNLAPADIPPAAVHPRDELVMPDDAPTPRRRGGNEPRPRQAAPARGKLSLRYQRRRTRMLVLGAAAHVEEERAEEQQKYDR